MHRSSLHARTQHTLPIPQNPSSHASPAQILPNRNFYHSRIREFGLYEGIVMANQGCNARAACCDEMRWRALRYACVGNDCVERASMGVERHGCAEDTRYSGKRAARRVEPLVQRKSAKPGAERAIHCGGYWQPKSRVYQRESLHCVPLI